MKKFTCPVGTGTNEFKNASRRWDTSVLEGQSAVGARNFKAIGERKVCRGSRPWDSEVFRASGPQEKEMSRASNQWEK